MLGISVECTSEDILIAISFSSIYVNPETMEFKMRQRKSPLEENLKRAKVSLTS